MAPLWHWGLTDHRCGIIVPFQPHEQKQGPEPPAVGTRRQRDTPVVPSPPPSGPRGDLGHPNVCRCRVRSRPRPISREGSGVFWPDTHGPTSPHGAEMLLGGRGHTQLMGRGLHICTSPPAAFLILLPPQIISPGGCGDLGTPQCHQRRAQGAEVMVLPGGGLSSQLPPPGSRIRPSCAAATPQLSQPKAWVTSALGPEGNQKAHIGGGGTFLLQAALPQGAAPMSLPQGPGQKEGGTKQPPPREGQGSGQLQPISTPSSVGGGSHSPQGHPLHGAEPQQSCPKVWGAKF